MSIFHIKKNLHFYYIFITLKSSKFFKTFFKINVLSPCNTFPKGRRNRDWKAYTRFYKIFDRKFDQ